MTKTYKDIVPLYGDYLDLQVKKYHSLEGDNPDWSEPQKEALLEFFHDIDHEVSIVDMGCGDGFGLQVLHDMGFENLAGIDLSPDKINIAFARKVASFLAVADLNKVTKGYFKKAPDIIYCSHTLEHCYNPGKVVDNFWRILDKDGELFVIIPYPDGGVDEAHGGKYEMGTNIDDELAGVTSFFEAHKFHPVKIVRGKRTGGEIRLWLQKMA